jgi:hypothetical protein
MTLETIRLELTAALSDEPATIVPCVRTSVLELRDRITDDMSDADMVSAIHTLVGIADEAAEYGRSDLADRLDATEQWLRDIRNAPAKPNEFRLSLNFRDGSISGGCADCNTAEVAEALGAIVSELQRMGHTPACIAFTGSGVEVETNL